MNRLPLFPLGVVLFPGMLLPLHVFEPRYRRLVRFCLDGPSAFGVALIREGEEVGGPAVPYEIGTSARILSAQPLPDGRFHIVCRGERRFSIEDVLDDVEPYLVGEVRWLDERAGEDTADLARRAAEAFGEYGLAVASIGGSHPDPRGDTPRSPVDLSYRIAMALGVESAERQRLLELDTAKERLAAEVGILERENAVLRDAIARQRARGEGPKLH